MSLLGSETSWDTWIIDTIFLPHLIKKRHERGAQEMSWQGMLFLPHRIWQAPWLQRNNIASACARTKTNSLRTSIRYIAATRNVPEAASQFFSWKYMSAHAQETAAQASASWEIKFSLGPSLDSLLEWIHPTKSPDEGKIILRTLVDFVFCVRMEEYI